MITFRACRASLSLLSISGQQIEQELDEQQNKVPCIKLAKTLVQRAIRKLISQTGEQAGIRVLIASPPQDFGVIAVGMISIHLANLLFASATGGADCT